MDKRLYLVTGAAGFLGNTLVRTLVGRGEEVRGLILNERERAVLDGLPVELVCGDVRDPAGLEPLFAGTRGRPVTVIHTASVVSITARFQQHVLDINVGGVANLLKLCHTHPACRLVYVSSVHAIPERPAGEAIRETAAFSSARVHGLYAKSKAEASALVMRAAREGLDASMVHPSGIIGKGDYGNTHLTQMVLDYLNGRLRACVNGGYDFVDVADVADGVLACAERGKRGECYILSNRFYTVKELLDTLHQVSGKAPVTAVLPFWLADCTAPLAERYYKLLGQPPLYTRYSLYTLRSNGLFSHEKATRELGYHPRPLRVTLQQMVRWLQEQHRTRR